MPAPQWAIEGLFEVNSLVMVAGPPASYKSFMVLDWAICMALGRKWNNRPTVRAKVGYALGEGKSSLRKRMLSWQHYHKADDWGAIDEQFRVTFDVPQMASKASVDNMLAGLETESFKPDIIVIDTFARSFVGLDENSQKDTGLWVEQADRLRQMGYTVIFLHHTAKNTEFGLKYRGSSAIMGAMDTAFTQVRAQDNESQVILSCSKQKDHDEGEPQWFQRVIVKPEMNEEGSIVLVPAVRIDERFTKEAQEKEAANRKLLDELVLDQSFLSDRARARKLSEMTGVTETAAQAKIRRRKLEIDAKIVPIG